MKAVAKFEKVSKEQYIEDFKNLYPNLEYTENDIFMIGEIWEDIQLPKRSDKGSAGYDFFCNFPIELEAGSAVTVPTGIRCKMDEDWVLMMMPRSGMGFKYGMRLNNTIGVIDSSYYNAKNEGHIMVKFTHTNPEPLSIEIGDRFVQGVFLPYGITVDDETDGERIGGLGSSGK